jgi:hypothetical protein
MKSIPKNITTRRKLIARTRVKKKNTTKKTRSSIVPANYYSKVYKNTQLIPKTQIINYMFSGYTTFKNERSDDKNPLTLEDCFIIDPSSLPTGLRRGTMDLSLKMNPKTPLDKLIAYCFYLKQPYLFERKDGQNENGISIIKQQIGKDIKRSDRTINGELFDSAYYRQFDENVEATDMFYQNIIDQFINLNDKNVNLNIVNKFALLSCQNIFNLITDLITIKLNEILAPETNSVFRPEKFTNITIDSNEMSMEFGLTSKLIISRDQKPIDPEYPCGNIEMSLFIDILHNKYELKTLKISYDIDKCGPELDQPIPDTTNNTDNKSKLKPEYAIPAGLGIAGIITTPFLLGALGGKRKKYNRRTKKIRNHK